MTHPRSPIEATLTLEFSDTVEEGSVVQALTISPPVPYKTFWSGKSLSLVFENDLEYGMSYTVSLGNAIDSRGNIIKEYVETFTLAPRILYFLSQDGILMRETPGEEPEKLSPRSLFIKKFVYDVSRSTFVALATSRNNLKRENQRFTPYIFDATTDSFKKLHLPFSVEKYFINGVSPVPFENRVLISRTKILQNAPYLELDSEPDATEVVSLGYDGKELTTIRTGNNLLHNVEVSPDGRSMLFIDESGALAIHNLSSGEAQPIVSDFLEQYGFSAYGTFVLFTEMTSESLANLSNRLVLYTNEGERIRYFDKPDEVVADPSLSRDDNLVAVSILTEAGYPSFEIKKNLGLLYRDSGEFKRLTTVNDGPVAGPHISPDGTYIAFNIFPNDFESAYDPQTGWNGQEMKIDTTRIRYYDIKNETFIDSQSNGANLVWVW